MGIHFYSNYLARFVLVLTISVFVLQIGCDSEHEEATFSFMVDEVELDDTPIHLSQDAAKQHLRSKIFYLKVCARKLPDLKMMHHGEFHFAINGKEAKGTTTDTNLETCAILPHELTYDTLSTDEFLPLELEVSSRRASPKALSINLKINPWQDALVDLRFKVAPLDSKITQKQSNYTIESWSLSYAGITAQNKSNGDLTIAMMPEVCIRNLSVREPPPHTKVRLSIVSSDASVEALPVFAMTGSDGCAKSHTPLSLAFNYWKKQEYLPFDLTVTSEDDDRGVVATKRIYLNPWLENHGLFAVEENPLTAENKKTASNNALFVGLESVKYEFPPQTPVETTDNFLNLRYYEFFHMSFQPEIFRTQNLKQLFSHNNQLVSYLPQMSFDLKLAFVALDPITGSMRYVSGWNALVETDEYGRVNIAVPFAYDFKERPLIESGLKVFLELKPRFQSEVIRSAFIELDFNYLLDSNRHLMVIDRSRDGDYSTFIGKTVAKSLQIAPLTLPDKLAQQMTGLPSSSTLLKTEATKNVAPYTQLLTNLQKDLSVSEFHLDSPDLNLSSALSENGVSRSVMEELVKASDREAVAKNLSYFCKLFSLTQVSLAGAARGSSCFRTPLLYFDVAAITLSDTISPTVKRTSKNMSRLDFFASFFKETTASDRVTTGTSHSGNFEAGVKGETGFKIFGNGATGFASVSYQYRKYYMTEESEFFDTKHRLQIRNNEALTAEENTFQVSGVFKHCVLLKPKNGIFKNDHHTTKTLGSKELAFLICKSERESRDESWYYIEDSQQLELSPLRHRRNLVSRSWLKLMRGKAVFQSFKQQVENKLNVFVLKDEKQSYARGSQHLVRDLEHSVDPSHVYYQDGMSSAGVLSVETF
jgi:hypothetical protein